MNGWREQILKEFTPNISRLTLAADPDGLLIEEGILACIRSRGFDLIQFENHIAFRYLYESKHRSHWDQGENTNLVALIHAQPQDMNKLPFDLLQIGRALSFSLSDIFPNLSNSVVASLNRDDFDALYEAQRRHTPGRLGDNATKDFALRHIYGIAPELIKNSSDLLATLLDIHYRERRIPSALNERFLQLMRQNDQFMEWPLERITDDREAFLTFLQERWPIFLDRMCANDVPAIQDTKESYDLSIKGTTEIPFDHQSVRVYMDHLFKEGLLRSVSHDHAAELSQTWTSVGVIVNPYDSRINRLKGLLEKLENSIPTIDSRHTDWLLFARGWAESIVLLNDNTIQPAELSIKACELRSLANTSFSEWLEKRYEGLISLPSDPPVMPHHIPRFLARKADHDSRPKIALIVMDGMALDQWIVIRNALESGDSKLRFRDQCLFAWIPSLTSVSRQSIFAGRAPVLFPDSIHTTEKEESLWLQFWEGHGYTNPEVGYLKGLGDGDISSIADLISSPILRIAGLVVDKTDKIMHGMQLGIAGMHNQIKQWAMQPYLNNLLNLLLDNDFIIYLTSDHGNIEAEGCGRPSDGSMAEERGERVRVYPDASLRHSVKALYPSATEWNPVGLPKEYLALLAPPGKAFIQNNHKIVCHGGHSLEEIVVPFVRIEREMA